ncbi:MAG: rod shape-determining protein MreC [Muribaculaceae bacterium]
MRDLINFIIRFSSWLVFAFYVTLSCILLFNHNPYQHHVLMTSANSVSASIYGIANNVTSYFNLRSINEDLQLRNAALETEVVALRKQVDDYRLREYADSMQVAEPLQQFGFVIAHVINNSVSRPYNYITIEKGAADGIRPEMGVVDHSGVVGVVNVVGEHYSRIISLLNPDFRLSCKIKGSDVFGSLVWDGINPEEALLEELPKHTVYNPGDTIITSGYSAMFPEGVPVGTVIKSASADDDNFFTLRIHLLTDFSQLSTVRVIDNKNIVAIKEVENSDLHKDNE